MIHRAIISFNPRRCPGMSAAIFVAFLAISVNAARADCVLPDNSMTLARVVTKEAKLYFVSGPREQAPECPSDANACRLNAYLVPGDEVLTNATDDRYVCAKFKSQSFVETIGYLPRASLELLLPHHPSIEKWNGTWRRDPEAEIVLKSIGAEVTVIGLRVHLGVCRRL